MPLAKFLDKIKIDLKVHIIDLIVVIFGDKYVEVTIED